MFVPNLRRLSRRRFVSLAGAAAATAVIGRSARAQSADIAMPAAYFMQGGTGVNETVNCGPAAVAAAVNYSQVAFPAVADVRATLGMDGPTSLDQWAWLLDVYGVPWYPTWSQPEMEIAIQNGHSIVIAAWMSDFSVAGDIEQAYSANWGQSGRYDSFSEGHALMIVGSTDGGANYLVHDPNVFPYDSTSYYGDGTPKGSFRRYSAAETWYTVGTYAEGLGLAVVPPQAPEPPPETVKRINTDKSDLYHGPGGGHAPERGERGVTGVITPNVDEGVISAASDDGS